MLGWWISPMNPIATYILSSLLHSLVVMQLIKNIFSSHFTNGFNMVYYFQLLKYVIWSLKHVTRGIKEPKGMRANNHLYILCNIMSSYLCIKSVFQSLCLLFQFGLVNLFSSWLVSSAAVTEVGACCSKMTKTELSEWKKTKKGSI